MKNKVAVTNDWYVHSLDYYYHEPSLAGHRLWGLQYQNLESIRPRLILVGSLLWFGWSSYVFCYFAFSHPSSKQRVTHKDMLYTFTVALIPMSKLLDISNASVLLSFMSLNCGVNPEENPHQHSEHANTTQKRPRFCSCSDLFALLWLLIYEKTVSPKESENYLRTPEEWNGKKSPYLN